MRKKALSQVQYIFLNKKYYAGYVQYFDKGVKLIFHFTSLEVFFKETPYNFSKHLFRDSK